MVPLVGKITKSFHTNQTISSVRKEQKVTQVQVNFDLTCSKGSVKESSERLETFPGETNFRATFLKYFAFGKKNITSSLTVTCSTLRVIVEHRRVCKAFVTSESTG